MITKIRVGKSLVRVFFVFCFWNLADAQAIMVLPRVYQQQFMDEIILA